jgi:nicotinamidase-related amidase
MQNDFLTGSLANPSALALVEPMKEFIEKFDGDILFTQDTHHEDYLETQEGKYLPIPHCIKGTYGWEIEKTLFDTAELKDDRTILIIEKPTFGYFFWYNPHNMHGYGSPGIGGLNVDEIHMVGVCTDICIVSNALILKSQYPETKIFVHKYLCAGLSEDGHNAALLTMKHCQVEIV